MAVAVLEQAPLGGGQMASCAVCQETRPSQSMGGNRGQRTGVQGTVCESAREGKAREDPGGQKQAFSHQVAAWAV